MEKDFIQRYAKIAKTQLSVLQSIYKEISGVSTILKVKKIWQEIHTTSI